MNLVTDSPQRPQIHIFTPAWGPHFIDLFDNALGMSFRWPKNAESLNQPNSPTIWTIVTASDEEATLLTQLAKTIIPTCEVRMQIFPELNQPNAPIGAIKMRGLLVAMKQCIKEATPMLMATPDFIYGDGTIETMLQTSLSCGGPNSTPHQEQQKQGICVSLCHLRTLPETLLALAVYKTHNGDKRPQPGPSNQTLLHTALQHPHASWRLSESAEPNNACYYSGVFWRFLSRKESNIPGANLALVEHHMPSPFLVNFLPEDYAFFSLWKGVTPPAFGEWDHNWPTELIKAGRLRYIGSSDAATMVEITEKDKNVPPICAVLASVPPVCAAQNNVPKPPNAIETAMENVPKALLNENDSHLLESTGVNKYQRFFLNNYHNNIQKQFLCVFRY